MTHGIDLDLMRAKRHAEDAVRVAQMRGWPVPNQYSEAVALVAAAETLTREPEPIAGAALPDPKKIRAYCDKLATERTQWRARTTVAREIADRAALTAAAAGTAAAPDITRRLVEETNDHLIPRLTGLLKSAPRALTGHESPEQLAEHTELLRTAEQLTAAAHDRAVLAQALGEGDDLGAVGAGFLLIDPVSTALAATVVTLVQRIANDGLPATLDQWAALADAGLSFAHPGQAATRMAAFNAVIGNAMRTPDGGQIPRTVGELAALTPVG